VCSAGAYEVTYTVTHPMSGLNSSPVTITVNVVDISKNYTGLAEVVSKLTLLRYTVGDEVDSVAAYFAALGESLGDPLATVRALNHLSGNFQPYDGALKFEQVSDILNTNLHAEQVYPLLTVILELLTPRVTLVGDTEITLKPDQVFVAPEYTSGVGETVTVSGEISTEPGTYTRTYTSTDEFGNTSDPVTLTIHVVEPTLTLRGSEEIGMYRDELFVDEGAVHSEPNATVTVTGYVDPSVSGEYVLTYSAGDGLSVMRVVTVRPYSYFELVVMSLLGALLGTCVIVWFVRLTVNK
jgi:PKD repeat protein